MKIVFRLNFHTVPGQSLWLQLATVVAGQDDRLAQVLPLRWINDGQWEAFLEIMSAGPLRLEYTYQLRQDDNAVELNEWNGPRRVTADPAVADCWLLADTWCAAGTVDYAFETQAFKAVLPARLLAPPPVVAGANYTFHLRMAAVPEGLAPCLLGGTRELGAWDWAHAVPLAETSANVWQAQVYLPPDRRV